MLPGKENSFSVTFVNRDNLSKNEVMKMLRKCGYIKEVHFFGNRSFVRYKTSEGAEKAVSMFGMSLGLSHAITRNSAESRYDGVKQHKKRQSNGRNNEDKGDLVNSAAYKNNSASIDPLGDKGDCDKRNEKEDRYHSGIKHSHNSSVSNGNISPVCKNGNSTEMKKDSAPRNLTKCPPLIDAKEMPELRCLVLANLPPSYTLENVYDLVEEADPVTLSDIDYSERKVKFCRVYVKDVANIEYLTKKLDNFVMGGKNLIAMEASAILAKAKWIS